MNFTEWCKRTRRIRRKIHVIGLKIFTWMNAVSLLFWILYVDGICSWQPYLIMSINFTWLSMMAYANGWMCDTKPYEERLKRERGETNDEV